MEQDLQDERGRQIYNSQSKLMAMCVLEYLRQQDVTRLQSKADLERETATATGISVRSLQRMQKESKEGKLLLPSAKRQRIATVLDNVDQFDEECIRMEILSFYERGEIPTAEAILKKVKEPPVCFLGGNTSLRKIMKKLGFRYKKTASARHILIERDDIVVARAKYLRILAANRSSNSPRPVIFLDETQVNQNESVSKCWTTDEGAVGPKLKTGKGDRFIIVHAGGIDGFVSGGLLMYKSSNGNKGDNHDSMNHECFHQWFESQLLPNIPANSIIVMDNAPYHSKVLNKAPNTSARKTEIIEWLVNNNIDHDANHTKPELLVTVRKYKDKQVYEIDAIARNHGHEVLRLPPYHCHLNPMELIWAQVKMEVRRNNSNDHQNLQRVEELTIQAMKNVSGERWHSSISHVMKLEEDYNSKDIAVHKLFENFRFYLADSSSDEM